VVDKMNRPEEGLWEEINTLLAKYAGRECGLLHNYPSIERTPKPPHKDTPLGSKLRREISKGDSRIRCGKGYSYIIESKNHYGPNYMLEIKGWYGGRAKFGEKLWLPKTGVVSGLMLCESKVIAQRIINQEVYMDGPLLVRMIKWAIAEGEKPTPCNGGSKNATHCFLTPPRSYEELKEDGVFRFRSGREYRVPRKDWPLLKRIVINDTRGWRTLEEVKKKYGE